MDIFNKNKISSSFDSVYSKKKGGLEEMDGGRPETKSSRKKSKSFFILLLIIIAVPIAYLLLQKSATKVLFQRFGVQKTLQEAGAMGGSASSQWWLSSGGVMLEGNNMFSTNLGSLGAGSSWQKLYAETNPRDTDGGFYPQNIFRLVDRNKQKNLDQEVYFNIDKINPSQSGYCNESNGVLFFNRYQDENNLYYTGLRVDGQAVIKKKINGDYYTMAEKPVFSDGKKYDRQTNFNLIPLHQWIGMRSEVETLDDGTVLIRFFVDSDGSGNWRLVLQAQDSGNKYGAAPFTDAGYGGLRSDFMDVLFKNYSFQELKN